jgi:hypothetical protein
MKNEEQAITQTFTNYIDSFQTLQTKNVLRFCDTLRLIISPQGLRTMTAPKEVEELIGQLMASLKARDFSRSEITNMRVSQMSDDIAFVSVSRVRYKTDGKELERLGETYTLQKMEAAWKIVTAIIHDADVILCKCPT